MTAKLSKLLLPALFITAQFIVNAQPIDRKDTLFINGLRQIVWMKGEDVSKPVFLFLHGGPGNSVMTYADKFCSKLYKHFIVVQWDQRETGETLKLNTSPIPLSLKVFHNDAEQLIDSLLQRFERKKLYIAGHSWGTALGFHLVQQKRQHIEAYFSIGSMVNQLESERIALDLVKTRAMKSGDSRHLAELGTVNIPFANSRQLYLHRDALLKFNKSKTKLSEAYVETWSRRWLKVFNEASKVNLFQGLPVVTCPVYFIEGRNDYQTNSALSNQYFQKLVAPAKGFYWIEGAGHSIPFAHGEKMQDIIISVLNLDR